MVTTLPALVERSSSTDSSAPTRRATTERPPPSSAPRRPGTSGSSRSPASWRRSGAVPSSDRCPVTFLADGDFVDELGVDVEPLSDEDAEYYAAIDRALGWIGSDLDSEAAWTELVETGVAAFYEPGRRRIVIRGERGEGELTVEQRAVLVHELTHAWQDQNFGLDTMVEDTETDLAWMSVVEGHAMHVESRYVATLPQEDQAAWFELEQARRTEHRVAHGDAVMYELALTAPYLLGERLVGAHAALGDTAGVDLLLEEPPYSSEQAMFAAVAAEGLGVTDVDPAVEPDGASWMEERPIGSWDVFTTLVTRLDGRTAVEASRAWAGGWETVYEDEAGDICVSWALAADDDAGRSTLSAALRSWVGAGPAGVAQVSEVEGDIIELAACDPGERAVSPEPVAVYDAVAWLLAHEDVVAGLASDVPIASADCAATRLLATLEPSDISFDGLAGESGPAGRGRGRVRGCLPGRAHRRGVAPTVHEGARTQASITYRRGMDRAVLTTGANSGLGLAIAVELAKRGYRSIGSVRTKAKAAEVTREAKASGVEIETVLLDVKDADRCAEVIDDAGAVRPREQRGLLGDRGGRGHTRRRGPRPPRDHGRGADAPGAPGPARHAGPG